MIGFSRKKSTFESVYKSKYCVSVHLQELIVKQLKKIAEQNNADVFSLAVAIFGFWLKLTIN